MMNNPCKSCCRQQRCDHFQRCRRWCAWFADEWQTLKELFVRQTKTP